ncbi:hypothetical protein WICPIJ_008182 [Wickerhamomyces pijperi]|uniref:ATPase expression protein 2, mitochondrial n=1 Tax=Wickerhamomyces pijperi TaxID=599730 RepID=A0A9P8Q029_WICPI|nr:hypothetical protein WICPIJ_008182 [Wickerhamomyces pijperi]
MSSCNFGLRKAATRRLTGSSAPFSSVSGQHSSMALNMHTLNDAQVVESNSATATTADEASSIKTVGDFIKAKTESLRSPVLLRSLQSSTIPTSPPITVQIPQPTPEITNLIRTQLAAQDYPALVSTLQSFQQDTAKWGIIADSLLPCEISKLILSLSNEQQSSYKQRTRYKYSSSIKDQPFHTTLAYKIVFVLRHLKTGVNAHYQLHSNSKAKKTTPFSQTDYDMFLRSELQSWNLLQAHGLIQEMELFELTKSIFFQNTKLRIMGNTNPTNWQLNKELQLGPGKKTHKYNNRLNRYTSPHLGYNIQPISALLGELTAALESSQLRPNLQTHKEIIGGFGRVGDLEQIKSHLNEVWGISCGGKADLKSSSSASELVKSDTLYPDLDLLQIVITSFGFNGAFGDSLVILNEFMEKYPSLSGNDVVDVLFWKVFFKQIEINYKDSADANAGKLYGKYFEMFWDHMIKSSAVQSVDASIYGKRLTYLNYFNKYEEMLADLPLLRTAVQTETSTHRSEELQNLISKYVVSLSKGLYSQVDTFANDDLVVEIQGKLDSIIEAFCVGNKQKKITLRRCLDVREVIKKEKGQFAALQEQYDEEDEENSIW